LFIILQKKKRSKEEHSFDPYTLNTDKKHFKNTSYLTGFRINPTIDRVGRRISPPARQIRNFIGEDIADGQGPKE
jgi:hypothetical protein